MSVAGALTYFAENWSITQSGRKNRKVASSSTTTSSQLQRVRNQRIVAAANSREAMTPLTHTSTTSAQEPRPISSSCGLKMNTTGSTVVRRLYQVACQPVALGSSPEIAAAAYEASPTGGVTSARMPK